MKENLKKCSYCGTEFTTYNTRKIYCKKSCKVRAFEARHNIDSPDFILGSNYETIDKEITVKESNPEYLGLQEKYNQIQSQITLNENLIYSHQNEILKFEFDSGKAAGGLGTGIASIALSENIKNGWLRLGIIIGSTYIGTQIFKRSTQSNQSLQYLIKLHYDSIKSIQPELSTLNQQLFELKSIMNKTPIEIEKKQIKQIKVPIRLKNKKHKINPNIMSASQLSELQFDLYPLDGLIGEFLGQISKNALITTYGKPGSGKSTFYVKLASYFTKYGMVLYVTPEEGISPTFKNKVAHLSTDQDKFHIADYNTLSQIDKTLKSFDYQFCFIDSITMIKDATPEEFDKLSKKYSNVVFFIIMQCNKDGSFKGPSEYSHNSDINIIVEDGVASTLKSRFNKCCSFKIFDID
jgi:tRNA A37 threonylcarbamoyladenosine biosynthesis protein TsaE